MNNFEIRIDGEEAKAILTFMDNRIQDEIQSHAEFEQDLPYITDLLNAYRELKRVLSE